MSEATQTAGGAEKAKKPAAPSRKSKLSRKTLRAEGRKKRKLKLQADRAAAKTFFEAKSKRSTDKKSAFRKKKKGKK